MTLRDADIERLFAYLDGEAIEPDESWAGARGDARGAEQLLAADEDARSLAASMLFLGEAARAFAAKGETQASTEKGQPATLPPDFTDQIMARIDADVSNVTHVSAVRPLRRRPGIVARTLAGGASFLALAAGVLFYVHGRPSPSGGLGPRAASERGAASPSAEVGGALALAGSGGAELEQLEAPSSDVSVFYVPTLGEGTASNVVVWVGDDSTGK